MNVGNFRQDHDTILSAVTDLRNLAQTDIIENADPIAQMIVSISSTIKLHLATEDSMLYPALARSLHADAAQVGKTFQSEMGGIAAAYLAFSRKWNYGPRVAAKPDTFKSGANHIFKALHERIQRENEELYPLVEKAWSYSSGRESASFPLQLRQA